MNAALPRWMLQKRYDNSTASKWHELRIATELRGWRLPKSGGARQSRWDPDCSQGGDVETETLLVECKRTTRSSFRLSREILKKVEEGARRRGKMPLLVLTFESPREQPTDLAIVRRSDLERLFGRRLESRAM